ncbi:MAG TPA: YdcF family protein [Azospirillum sp.]|nr:YdcF family protein [Azospirillum sp.]
MARAFGRREGGVARMLGRVVAALVLLALVWAGGLVWFVSTIPREEPPGADAAALRRTDAIVVLTGGSARLTTGLKLLAAGAARKLFVSGVYEGVDVQELLRLSRQAPGDVECCIVLGYAADSTIGNAYETEGWMSEQGYASLRLVTANYHMRRSLLEFRMAMPEVAIIPHPVVPPNVHLSDWWLRRGTASLLITEYNKYLVAVLRYWLEKSLES